uniref:Cell division protein n=1 Tax=Pyramimonas parkeae TaxID=36894 RepID=C0JX55_9CHLO|nr:cell division protein [Pyramimonas parkeae]ACJ71078.1 cell division protein [Pyramimonas parkeae]
MFLNILIETEKYKKSSRLTKAIIKKSHQNKKRLKDLAGIEKIQPDLKELIYLLRSSKKTSQFTNRLQSKGFLFVGPPGTGKTLLAQAIAGTAGVTLYATVASEFIDGQKGIGCCRLRDLFEKAKKDSPSIIFIDEIDTLAKAREGRINSLNQQTTDEEKIQIFTEFLVQMDGFSKQENIIIIGATNFCENLDPAFLRPGRFDRLFQLESPNQKTRVSILRLHVNKHNKKRGENIIKWAQFAQLTAGFTGADLSAMVNESLLYAIRTKNRSIHDTQTLEHGFKRIATYSGPKNEIGQTEVFSKIQDAYYKASKQLFATYFKKSFQKHFLPPIFFFHLENRPKNQRYLRLENEEQKMQFDYLPKKYLEIQLIEYLIGIATESFILNKISSEFWLSQQGEKDMQKATNLIHKMVSDYAMEIDHFFFEKSYNTVFEKDWGEFWSLFQKEWNNYLQDKKDRGIKMDWRFFESWAWLETNQIYTQRNSFLWNESILDKNKESLLPDLYYQPQQNRIIGLDELLKNYLMKSYCRAVCLVKKEMDYLDLIAHQNLLKGINCILKDRFLF